ncbi:MAG TPA: rRNA maturation RNase YbeY [Burkholderiaceae bacterium]|nr:rRNA maturation RNase YbeY [Burkholderiaceae bacterium]
MTTLALAVQYADARAKWLPDRAQVRRWARATLDAISPERASEITVRFVSSKEARTLNITHRGRDYIPNVLTFNLHEGLPLAMPVTADIVVCMSEVARQARAQRKTLPAHCAHMVVHGVLHAHGFDHGTNSQAKLMEALERFVLMRFKIADPYIER